MLVPFGSRRFLFESRRGEYVALMGTTGVGKTTLLEAVCGLYPIASGQIRLGERDLTRLAPGQRSIGYVPQDLALFSTMSVADNLAYGLRLRDLSEVAIADRVTEIAGLLSIGDLLSRYPAKLSGGEARRVALGRALCISPKLLLFDEPLSGLDDATRNDICNAIETVHQSSSAAVMHVTHDQRDVIRLADRLLMLRDGSLQECSIANLEAAGGTKLSNKPIASPHVRASTDPARRPVLPTTHPAPEQP